MPAAPHARTRLTSSALVVVGGPSVAIGTAHRAPSGPLAQLVEQRTLNPEAEGSSPSWPTARTLDNPTIPNIGRGPVHQGLHQAGTYVGLANLVHSPVISGVLTISPTEERNPAERKSVAGFSMLLAVPPRATGRHSCLVERTATPTATGDPVAGFLGTPGGSDSASRLCPRPPQPRPSHHPCR
jgi:hypothetical protein